MPTDESGGIKNAFDRFYDGIFSLIDSPVTAFRGNVTDERSILLSSLTRGAGKIKRRVDCILILQLNAESLVFYDAHDAKLYNETNEKMTLTELRITVYSVQHIS